MRRRLGDERRAEARLAVTLTGILLALMVTQFLAWALLAPSILAAPTGSIALLYWGAQIGAFVLCFLGCVLGFKPAISICFEPGGLLIRRPDETLRLAAGEVFAHEVLSPLLFHRHYRRYARTHVFVNRLTDAPLLLQTAFGPVVLGLSTADQTAVLRRLDRPTAPVFTDAGEVARLA